MDVGYLIKKALVLAFASLAVPPPILLFALDMDKWMAALLALLWLPWGLFICFIAFARLYTKLIPAGNRHARALLARAGADDSDVQFALGKAINEGRFGLMVSNIDPAQRWYQQAADQGHSEAAFITAEHLMITEDYDLTNSSLELTDPGEVFRPIIIIDFAMRSRQRAAGYYQTAAGAGHAGAMGRLGNMYLLGNAVTPDSASAYIWLARAISAVGDLSDQDIGKWEEYHDDLRFWTAWRD
jgi:hypothetical protein